jgi:hypothetical protein
MELSPDVENIMVHINVRRVFPHRDESCVHNFSDFNIDLYVCICGSYVKVEYDKY